MSLPFSQRMMLRFRRGWINTMHRDRSVRMQKVFSIMYDQKIWRGGYPETGSGKGSTLASTRSTSEFIERVLAEFPIRSIVDIGCGEMNWQQHLRLESIERYHGVDVVRSVIDGNRARFRADPRFSFSCEDASVYRPTGFDLAIAREVMIHLSFDTTNAILANLADCRFLIATYHPGRENTDIRDGGFYLINLLAPPFSLPEPIVSDVEDGQPGRRIGLWDLTSRGG